MKIPYLDLRSMQQRHKEGLTKSFQNILDSGWYIQGSALEVFESDFAKFTGVSHCIGCGNGLDALRLVLEAWKIQGKLSTGDKVLVPSNTYIATWLAITHSGLIPIPVEPDPITCNISPEGILRSIQTDVKAVIPVHLYGRMSDMPAIMDIAEANDLWVLEDAAQAHGAVISGKSAGAWGHASAFSFYPGKNLGALGDAGAITTDDTELSECLKALRNYGSVQKYYNTYIGFNSRLDELQAAFLSCKLPYLKKDNTERNQIARDYIENIRNEYVHVPANCAEGEHVWHIFQVQTNFRNELQEYLKQNSIGSMIHYPVPPHQQQAYVGKYGALSLPLSEKIHATTLSLPLYPGMSRQSKDRVIHVINEFKVNT